MKPPRSNPHREPDRRRDPEQEAAGLGGGDRRPDQARRRVLVRRLGGGVRPDGPGARRRGHLRAPVRRQAAQQLPGLVGSRGRGPGGGPHLHRLRARAGRRPNNNWRAPAELRAELEPLFDGSMQGRTMYVVPVLDGPAGLPDREDRRAGHRLALRGRVDADHDPHGPGRPGRAGREGEFVPCVHSVGAPLAEGERGRAVAHATRTPSTSCTTPRRARSGRTGRATAATRCWARSAWRCGSPRCWPATRAGWPSTC